MAADASGGGAEAFDGDDALRRGQESCCCGRIGEQEAPDAEEKGERASEEIDSLPGFEVW
jgi:hypothetical protein